MRPVAVPVALLVIVMVAACARSGSSATPTPPPSPLLRQLDAGEAMWRGAGVINNRIVVAQTISSFAPTSQVFTITVRDGKVVDQSAICRSGPCGTGASNAEEYTVAGLFAWARGSAGDPKLVTQLALDPTYGFPTTIATSVSNATESSGGIHVEQFQPLP